MYVYSDKDFADARSEQTKEQGQLTDHGQKLSLKEFIQTVVDACCDPDLRSLVVECSRLSPTASRPCVSRGSCRVSRSRADFISLVSEGSDIFTICSLVMRCDRFELKPDSVRRLKSGHTRALFWYSPIFPSFNNGRMRSKVCKAKLLLAKKTFITHI